MVISRILEVLLNVFLGAVYFQVHGRRFDFSHFSVSRKVYYGTILQLSELSSYRHQRKMDRAYVRVFYYCRN
jgi:hypothetical protein